MSTDTPNKEFYPDHQHEAILRLSAELKSKDKELSQLRQERDALHQQLKESLDLYNNQTATIFKLTGERDRMKSALEDIRDYWNRDRNDSAMHDACWHAINAADESLKQ